MPEHESRQLFDRFLRRFTGGVDARWWWEHFTDPVSVWRPEDGHGFERLTLIVPDPGERVWFVAEDDELDHYPVYEATVRSAQLVIGNCYGFEYYLIAKDLSWLLCENHHDTLTAVGDGVRERLDALAS